MSQQRRAIVVGASVDELAHVQQCLPEWECMSVALNDEETGPSSQLPPASLVIVHARKEQEKTRVICEQLLGRPDGSAAPLLLVIGQYDISQGLAVRGAGRATLILAPFGEEELRSKIAELLGTSQPERGG